ncbi:hypothetical protein PAMP_020233 [Pampus punctatissimus]
MGLNVSAERRLTVISLCTISQLLLFCLVGLEFYIQASRFSFWLAALVSRVRVRVRDEKNQVLTTNIWLQLK